MGTYVPTAARTDRTVLTQDAFRKHLQLLCKLAEVEMKEAASSFSVSYKYRHLLLVLNNRGVLTVEGACFVDFSGSDISSWVCNLFSQHKLMQPQRVILSKCAWYKCKVRYDPLLVGFESDSVFWNCDMRHAPVKWERCTFASCISDIEGELAIHCDFDNCFVHVDRSSDSVFRRSVVGVQYSERDTFRDSSFHRIPILHFPDYNGKIKVHLGMEGDDLITLYHTEGTGSHPDPILQTIGLGSEGRTCTFMCTGRSIMVTTGCFFGTLQEFEDAVKQTYSHPAQPVLRLRDAYLAAIAMAYAHFRSLLLKYAAQKARKAP